MHTAIENQLLSGFKSRERIDGQAFTYGRVAAIGILGVPSLEVQLEQSGPAEKVAAVLEVRRSWFPAAPEARLEAGLAVFALTGDQLKAAVRTGAIPPALVAGAPLRKYFVTGINSDDPLAYVFTLVDRN